MQEAPRNANLGSMWQTVFWSTSRCNDRLSTTPWAIHSPPQIWKVQDWLSESLRGAVLGHKNEETESYVGMFWTKICPVGSESKTRLQLESVQVVEAVARSWHESSLCRDLFSNFTSGSRPELSKVAKPWSEWSHSECQAKCSGLYKGHPTCFHWAAFAAHVDPVKIGRPTTQLPAKWPHHPHLTPVQAQCTMTCRKMSGFILCRIPWSFSPHRWRQATVTITFYPQHTAASPSSDQVRTTWCQPCHVMRRNGTADHKWQRSEQLGHKWSGATMLGSVKYLQQRSMHQYNQNICQCYRLSQQEQGNLKVEATGNFEPPTFLPHAKRSANAPPGSFPSAFPHTKTIQLTCNCATPKSRGCDLVMIACNVWNNPQHKEHPTVSWPFT